MLKVIIQPGGAHVGLYPVYKVLDDGIHVGPGGELILEAEIDMNGNMTEGRIYAPGAWKEVTVEKTTD
jgi:hypothetical protein